MPILMKAMQLSTSKNVLWEPGVPGATCLSLRACGASLWVCFECVWGGAGCLGLRMGFRQIGDKRPNHCIAI